MLRRFLYLDTELTTEFLAQLEGGVFSEEGRSDIARTTDDAQGGISANLGVVAAGGKKSNAATSETATTRTVRQTPESEFARLHALLSAVGELELLEVVEEEAWDRLRRGEIIEVDTVTSVSSLIKFANIAEQVGPLFDVMATFGETVAPDTREAMSDMRGLSGLFGAKTPIVALVASAPKFKFVANLETENIRVDLDELDGEVTLLAKIQRKLGANEKYTVFESMPGLGSMPRALRRSMQKGVKNERDIPDLVVPAPAAVVTVIAIYR